jgi:hypothetical protein
MKLYDFSEPVKTEEALISVELKVTKLNVPKWGSVNLWVWLKNP